MVIPIRLDLKLTQNDPEIALERSEALLKVFLGLDEFGITLQKGQYDNVQMLLDLTSEYMRFLTTDSLRIRKENLSAMNALLEAQGTEATITRIRELYTEIFKA